MKTVTQQISECIKLYTKWYSIKNIEVWDINYLFLWINNTVYSSLIIDSLTFEVADLLESKVNPTETSIEDKEKLKLVITNFIEWATEVKKEDFNKYSFDWNMVFIQWSKYWLTNSDFLWIFKLLKDFTELKIFIKDWLIAFTDFHNNILILKWMYLLQESLF